VRVIVMVVLAMLMGVMVLIGVVLRHEIASGRVEGDTISPRSRQVEGLLYVLATRQPGEAISFPVEGIDGGSISMLTAQVG
jgi:hypothetical protein